MGGAEEARPELGDGVEGIDRRHERLPVRRPMQLRGRDGEGPLTLDLSPTLPPVPWCSRGSRKGANLSKPPPLKLFSMSPPHSSPIHYSSFPYSLSCVNTNVTPHTPQSQRGRQTRLANPPPPPKNLPPPRGGEFRVNTRLRPPPNPPPQGHALSHNHGPENLDPPGHHTGVYGRMYVWHNPHRDRGGLIRGATRTPERNRGALRPS